MLEVFQAKLATPFAVLGIRVVGERLTGIEYLPVGVATLAPLTPLAERVCRQLERYLDDPQYRFDLPFDYVGTPFQCRVWQAISEIKPGSTMAYIDIARQLRTAPRPVGGACGANRLPILIPCHRVVAAHGLGGFMNARAGVPLDIKQWLLQHEGAFAPATA
jgi:methylated-DNA-[protein]-cysteine S-methyltransferase